MTARTTLEKIDEKSERFEEVGRAKDEKECGE